MERSQWDHRKKMELARLHDLDHSIIEKYGHDRGWKLSLRFDQLKGDGKLKYSEPLRTTNGSPSALVSILNDDRTTPVELIRTPQPEQQALTKSKSQMEFRQFSFQSDKSVLKRGISSQHLQKYLPSLQGNQQLSLL